MEQSYAYVSGNLEEHHLAKPCWGWNVWKGLLGNKITLDVRLDDFSFFLFFWGRLPLS